MKKILTLLVLATGVATVSHAQIQKGNVLVGGDIAGLSLGLDKGSYLNLSINPKTAWFIQDNIAIGGYIKLGVLSNEGSNTETTYGVGALARYYFGLDKVNTEALLKHTRFFLEGNAGLDGDNVSHGSTTNGLGLGIGPGVAYFITPNIGLEALLKYDGIIGGGNNIINNKLDFNVGFQVYLPGKNMKDKVMKDVGR